MILNPDSVNESFLKKYACFYGNIDLTPAEQEDIGSFAARLLKLASDQNEQGIVDLFLKEFGDIDEATFDRMNRYVEYLDKVAQGPFHGVGGISNILAPLAIALAVTPLLGGAIKSVSSSMSRKAALKKALELHPEIKNDPNIEMYFQAIASFAPAIATNALMVGNILSQMHRIGPSALTPQLLNDLIGMQSKVEPPSSAKGDLAKTLMEAAKIYAPKKN